ncbi:MAG: lasso RiPP family leader peptide-containing protein [Parahaliea sp.]
MKGSQMMHGAGNVTNSVKGLRKTYSKPELKQVGTLEELTQGFAGSVPDEQGANTKRNPFQG